MNNQHWLDRWRENRIGFHEADVNRYLQTYLPAYGLAPGATIFLPLCGKALDIAWLARQGYRVIGSELSQIAVEDFFAENSIEYEVDTTDARFRRYLASNICLLQGDHFDLRAADLEDCSLVYDRAALIAMTADQRPAYYTQMLSLIPPQADMLLITLDYDQNEMPGPPYAVSDAEVEANYRDHFRVERLELNDIIDERPRWRQVGMTALSESVFRLDR